MWALNLFDSIEARDAWDTYDGMEEPDIGSIRYLLQNFESSAPQCEYYGSLSADMTMFGALARDGNKDYVPGDVIESTTSQSLGSCPQGYPRGWTDTTGPAAATTPPTRPTATPPPVSPTNPPSDSGGTTFVAKASSRGILVACFVALSLHVYI